MQASCPKCREAIPAENIAMATGWAKCARCNEVYQLSEVLPGHTGVSTPEPVPERPFDARAIVERSADKLIVHIPFPGFKIGHLGWLALALFVVACIAILTADARDRWLHREMGWDDVAGACFIMLLMIFLFWVFLRRFFSTWGRGTIYVDASWIVTESRGPLRWRCREKIDRSRVQGERKWEVDLGGLLGSEAEADWLAGQIDVFLQTVPYKAPVDKEGPEEIRRRRGEHRVTRAREDDHFHS